MRRTGDALRAFHTAMRSSPANAKSQAMKVPGRGPGGGLCRGSLGSCRVTRRCPRDPSSTPALTASGTATRRLCCRGDALVFTPSSLSLLKPAVTIAHRVGYRTKSAFSVTTGPLSILGRTSVLGSFPTLLVLILFSFPCLCRSRPRELCLKSSRLLKAVK